MLRPNIQVGVAALVGVAIAGCAGPSSSRIDPRYGVASSPQIIPAGQPVPKGGGTYRVGTPYSIAGRTYVPEEDRTYRAEGVASWYGSNFHGRRTANGEVYDMHALSAAHPTLPLPSYVRVTNVTNRRSVIVRVNDRGPYHGNRLIDVSGKAAELLAFRHNGIARVQVEYVGPAPLEGSDDRILVATLREGAPAPAPSPVRVASARPFIPEVARGVLRGPAPLPPERPFDLGPGPSAREALRQANGLARASELSAARSVVSERRDRALPSASAAFGPIAPALGVASGRGLY